MKRSKGYTSAALLTLALGIGATTAVFSFQSSVTPGYAEALGLRLKKGTRSFARDLVALVVAEGLAVTAVGL